MKDYQLRIVHDHLERGESIVLPQLHRVVFCRQGRLRLTANGTVTELKTDEAAYTGINAELESLEDGSIGWRWELEGVDEAIGNGTGPQPGGISDVKGIYPLPALKDGVQYALRCDRVSFPPGGEALTHTHAAAGVRCAHTGEIFIDSLGHQWTAKPGDTWLERGPESVYAKAWNEGPMNFVRVMLVPETHFGRSTISYVLPEDQDRPKSQAYQRFLEQPVVLQ